MNLLSLAYFSIDLSLPVNGSIDRLSPAWSTNLLDLYINTIDVFSKYDNVLAYNVGNEVVIAPEGTDAAAFIKAAARDVKAYLFVLTLLSKTSSFLTFVFLAPPSLRARSLVMPPSTVTIRGWIPSQTISAVTSPTPTLARTLSTSLV